MSEEIKHVLFDFMMHDGVNGPLTTIIGKWVGLNAHILRSKTLIQGLQVAVAAAGIAKAGEALEKGAIAMAKANAQASHPYFKMQMAGVPQAEAASLRDAARRDRTPGLDYETRFNLAAEAKSLYGAGAGATREAASVLPALASATAIIRNFDPKQSLEEASENAFQILRARDATGKLTDKNGNIIDSQLQAQMAQGLGYYMASNGQLDGAAQMTQVKREKSARGVPTVEGEDAQYAIGKVLGPAASGTMFSTFINSTMGNHATDQAKRALVELGWGTYGPDPKAHAQRHGKGSGAYGDAYSSHVAHPDHGKGNFGTHLPPVVGNADMAANTPAFLLADDPLHRGRSRYDSFLAYNHIAPAMDGQSAAAVADNQRFKREMSLKAIAMGFNPNTAGEISELMANMGQIQREMRAAQVARNSVMSGNTLKVSQDDPLTQANNIKEGLETIKQSVFDSAAAVPAMKAFSAAISGISNAATAHPGIAGALGIGALGAGVAANVGGKAVMGYMGWKLVKGLLGKGAAGGVMAEGGTAAAATAGEAAAGGLTAAAGGEVAAGALATILAPEVMIPLAIAGGIAFLAVAKRKHDKDLKAKAALASQGGDGNGFAGMQKQMADGWNGVSKAFNDGATNMFNSAVKTIQAAEKQAVAAISVPMPPLPSQQQTTVNLHLDKQKVGSAVFGHGAAGMGGGVSRGLSTSNMRATTPRRN